MQQRGPLRAPTGASSLATGYFAPFGHRDIVYEDHE